MQRMRHCDRKQFKLVMEDGRVIGDRLSLSPPAPVGAMVSGVVAVVGVIALVIMAWLWLLKPYIERRWMSPRFLGHYLLYPEEGGQAEPSAITDEPQTSADVANSTLFDGMPWMNRANARRNAEKVSQRDMVGGNANSMNHPYISDMADHPAAMVPAVDASGAPIALDASATMADIREAMKESGSRTVGVLRQGGVIRLFKPRDGASWTMYGQAPSPSDQSVAVFHLPKRQWWWKVVEGPSFDEN